MTDEEYIDVNKVMQPAALPQGLSPKAVEKATNNITLILGAVVLLVIVGAFITTWFDKQMSEAIIALAGVALGYLGKLVSDTGVADGKTSSN